MKVEGVVFNSPGIHRIEATTPDAEVSGRSNAVLCTSEPPEFAPLWGGLHVHTVVSDGAQSQDTMFEFSREISGLDFQATSEHSWKQEQSPIMDIETTQQVEAAYEPGIFTTIKGFEWNSAADPVGHHNVYYRGIDPPIIPFSNGPFRFHDAFFSEVAKYEAIIIPHHVAKGIYENFYKRWELHPVKQERLVEIYSTHGLSEYQGNFRAVRSQMSGHNVQDALVLGYKLGFVAASDSHTSRPGLRYSRDMGYRDGITCIYTRSNTRDDVWQALWDRRCYATTGYRVLLEFSINGEMMGREIPMREGEPVELGVRVAGLTELSSVEIVKGHIGDVTPLPAVHTMIPASEICDFTWTDPEPPSDCFYYVRVTQTDEEMAWSSPIWVSPSLRIQEIHRDPSTGNNTIRWGCLPYRLYGIYYKDTVDSEWCLAETDLPPDDSGVAEWIDDGSHTGIHPASVQKRFYSVRADT
jgi:hypothetical protein